MRLPQWLSKAPAETRTFQLPDAVRLYVIGDIHGRADLLLQMDEAIAADLSKRPVPRATIVLLGDYVDRGPKSSLVLDHLSSNQFSTEIVALKGNHELMLLEFLENPEAGANWRQNGGLETLHSYGIDVRELKAGQYEQVAESFRNALPSAHLHFLRNTRLSLSIGDFFLCHAGIRPGIALERQSQDDLLWIREPFLSSRSRFAKMVVHGHTPVIEPDIRPNRINIDTGAYISGRLTCLVLEQDRRHFLFTGARSKQT